MLTPSEIAMTFLLGRHPSSGPHHHTTAELIRKGREQLRGITGQDFRYDAKAWHDYLVGTDDGGYLFNGYQDDFRDEIQDLENNDEWILARKILAQIPDPPSPPSDAPEPIFKMRQRVVVVHNHRNHTIRRGRIRYIQWHFKRRCWMYFLITRDGSYISKRYFKDDLSPL